MVSYARFLFAIGAASGITVACGTGAPTIQEGELPTDAGPTSDGNTSSDTGGGDPLCASSSDGFFSTPPPCDKSTLTVNGQTRYACKCGSCLCGFVCGSLPIGPPTGGTLGGVCGPPTTGGQDAGVDAGAGNCSHTLSIVCECGTPNPNPGLFKFADCSNMTAGKFCYAYDRNDNGVTGSRCVCRDSEAARTTDTTGLAQNPSVATNIRTVANCPL